MKKSISLVCTVLALVLACLMTSPLMAQDAPPTEAPETVSTPPTETADIAEKTIDAPPVATRDTSSTDTVESIFGFNYTKWTPMLGRFHPLVLHLPIGLLIGVFLLEFASLFRTFQNVEPAHWLFLIFGTLSAIVAAAFGYFLSWEGGYDADTIFWHLWSGVGLATLCVVAIILRGIYSYTWKYSIRHAYRGTLICIMVLLSITGHFGGNLSHGEAYLFENIPEEIPIPDFIYSSNPVVVESGNTYADVILPILKQQCFECHGDTKQKGDYQLTTRELMLTAGESEKAPVVPGNAFASELVRLIALPAEHDDLMPPKGKGTLTSEEILAVMQWIDRGADFGDGAHVIELEAPEMAPAVIDTSDLDKDKAVNFAKHIWPIIEASCLECHDAEEQEGDLRLDTKTFILLGGGFGPVFEAGNVEDSTFYELITLDEDDPDFMPAKNDPLPEDQIALIKRWIEEGCDFGEWTGE